ncbi:type I DNA topoisomerase [Candidatus Uhrbacteria bacterium]|nr:type I DNA topoisomerase [Candidatus Uhrbacteria bacterium]
MYKLLIVESPTKAKTISKYLGKDYRVLSSFGHVRDLPKNETGVDTEHGFTPTYIVPDKSKGHVAELKAAAKNASEILLATDEDREGEAIAWHIASILDVPTSKMKRITFHEITKAAVDKAVEHPRAIDENLVNAQQARRIVDRLVGYELSPLLWTFVQRGLSAGRVQSVAMRIIVERERERNAFKKDEYWTIDAMFAKDAQEFEGKLQSIDGKALEKLTIGNEIDAKKIESDLQGATYSVANIEKKEVKKSPVPPFTTSTLQIEGNNKLGFSAKQTMMYAQHLYETGRITYMRTDSVNMSDAFIDATQTYAKKHFGEAYVTGGQRYKTNKKGAQEAHEAIRPSNVEDSPLSLKSSLVGNEWKLYDLIWRRAVGSQLPPAVMERTAVDIKARQYNFRANGNTVVFDGFTKVYRAGKETFLPPLALGDAVDLRSLKPEQHFTEPPPRYSDASLVKLLEEHGVGRPSTYAPTISTVIDRGYVERDEQKKLFPTDTAFVVNDLLVAHFPSIVDIGFTSKLEGQLDEVADGELAWVPMLEAFYTPFHQQIETKKTNLKRTDAMKEKTLGDDPATKLPIYVKTGKFGTYLQIGEAVKGQPKPKSITLPKPYSYETVTFSDAITFLSLPRALGNTTEGEPMEATIGRFGPYIKAGKVNASIPPEKDLFALTHEEALQILKDAIELKRQQTTPMNTLGTDPAGATILVKNGRFGPYVTDGTTNCSVPKAIDPMSITLEKALDMLQKKREKGPSRWGNRGGAKKKAEATKKRKKE